MVLVYVLCCQYVTAEAPIRCDQCGTYIVLGLQACLCVTVVGQLYVFRRISQTAHLTAVTIMLLVCGL